MQAGVDAVDGEVVVVEADVVVDVVVPPEVAKQVNSSSNNQQHNRTAQTKWPLRARRLSDIQALSSHPKRTENAVSFHVHDV